MMRRRNASWVTALLTGALLSASVVPAAAEPAKHPCSDASERCDGTIEVPLDWDDPSGEKIEIAFAWLPRRDRSVPAEGTVLAMPGGPSPALRSFDSWAANLGPVLDRQNMLMVEPRGFDKSSKLSCQGFDYVNPESIKRCADELDGDRMLNFTAASISQDYEAVRAAMGIDELSLWGASYGTVYGQAYATRFPDRVRAVFLDSALATDDAGYASAFMKSEAVDATNEDMRMLCERSEACRDLDGDPVRRLADVADRLRRQPDPRIPLANLQELTRMLFDATVAREFNAATAAYLDGDPAPLRRLLIGVEPIVPSPHPEKVAQLAIICGSEGYPMDRDASTEVRKRQIAEFYRSGQRLGAFERSDLPGWIDPADSCPYWPMGDTPTVPPGAEYPDAPTVVMGGTLDPGTPEGDGAEVARRFPNSTLITVPFGSHVPSQTTTGPYGTCARDVLRAFLADPGRPVDDPGCDGESFRAIGEYPRSLADVAPAVGGDLTDADRTLLAAVHATAHDAAMRRHPEAMLQRIHRELPGLRGGTIRYDDQAAEVRLDGVSYVDGVVVDGRIRVGPAGAATAELTTNRNGRVRTVELAWELRDIRELRQVTGTLDGTPFTTAVPDQ